MLRHFLRPVALQINLVRFKKSIDYSRVPVLNEAELEMKFVRGSGPGGQSVNKTSNCCVLKHIPTGIIVKCHIHRSVTQNTKEARQILITRLDNLINKEHSIESQMKAIEEHKSAKQSQKRKKLLELKERWRSENENQET